MAFGAELVRSRMLLIPGRPAPDRKVTRLAPGERKAAVDLRAELDAYLTGTEERRLGGEYVHASRLFDLCTRQHVLASELSTPLREVVPVRNRVRWDIGNIIHDLVRDRYLGPMGRAIGDWRCVACRRIESGRMPTACACGGDEFRYVEREVRNEQEKIVGHVDCMDDDPVLGMGDTEIKSIDGNVFRTLKRPQPRHVFQTQTYLWLTGFKWGRILYVSIAMADLMRSPFKSYLVRFDPRVPERIKRVMAEVRAGGKRVCKEPTDGRALGCPLRTRCFG